ncbi:helix-turn-helix domain-containing protein [Limoniibacter endophyticus]|uniref:HTH cro/C1-type domain-containing protein n=1 Tax=Limoniibacter endophyticus TaxID=1565040 RepID=A0A8J3DM65_9HYPH|nr:helix-turn-helix transcriptional regulator [Limoniibacter endophyticus]GHC66620.1 hypothetical protein GCM10010136_09850 [Limoniibacter endophyticus]
MNVRVILLTINHKINVAVIFVAVTGAVAYSDRMITPSQIKAARAFLNWKQTDLATAADVSEMSVKNIERGQTDPRVSTIQAIRTALEKAGIEFISNERGEGVVRLRKADQV